MRDDTIANVVSENETVKRLSDENTALRADLATEREEKLMWNGKCMALADELLATQSDLALHKEALNVVSKYIDTDCDFCVHVDNDECGLGSNEEECKSGRMAYALSEAAKRLGKEEKG